MSQKYKVIEGGYISDLEVKVNYFLENNPSYRVHGEIQMFGHSNYAQLVVAETNQT